MAFHCEVVVRLHIEFERSGGFAGVTLRASIDSSKLPPKEAAELEALVKRANLPALAARSRESRADPDRFQYALTVVCDDHTQQLRLGEREVTAELRPLLNRLLDLARRR